MSGYYGFSMSNNARAAYADGLKPFSKWTKTELIEKALEFGADKSATKLTVAELRTELLRYAEWHHTSSHFNATDFYKIDENSADKLTAERVNQIIKSRAPKKRKGKTAIQRIKATVNYVYWTGSQKHPQAHNVYGETVYFNSNEKMVKTMNGVKRLSSLTIISQEVINDEI